MSRLEAATRAVLALAEAINQHDSAGLQAVLSAEVTLEASTPAPNGTVFAGREAVLAFWQKVWQDHPAFQYGGALYPALAAEGGSRPRAARANCGGVDVWQGVRGDASHL